MNSVTINRRRFLRTYRQVAFVLQILCCIATTATFVRVLHQQQLPPIFLILPSLLFLVLSIDRCIPFHDRFIISIFIGATTGFISGFVSNVTVGSPDEPSSPKRNVVLMICTLEFLHLPVVIGVVMYSFCLIFSRPPRLTIIVLSFAVAVCGTVVVNVGSTVLFDQENTDDLGIGATASVFVFLLIFFVALLPSVQSSKRAWIVCAAGFAANVYWQSGFFDTLQWNWEASAFPIPGFLTGLVTIFLLDVADLRETDERSRTRRLNENLNELPKKTDDLDAESLSANPTGSNNITTALTWHAFSYIVERTSLSFIMERRGHRDKQSIGDTWISCLAMLGVLAILTSERYFSLTVRLVILVLGLFLYVCMAVIHGHLSNGFFLDDVFGLAFLATAATSDHIAL